MPEVCEIVLTAHYLMTKLKNRFITDMQVLSGRYTHENMKGKELIDKLVPLKIINIDSKGKFLWFELFNEKLNKTIYMMNTFGLVGSWTFKEDNSNRVEFTVENKDKSKIYHLYFRDPRNFGTLKIVDNVTELYKKIDKLAVDLLKTDFTVKQFMNWLDNYKYKDREIIKVLMNQEVNQGIGSGLGNYLAPEILYNAKISPFRTINSLTLDEKKNLANSVKYILKLCYFNNKIGYMVNFKNFIDKHKNGIKSGKFPDFHKNVKLGDNTEFEFSVYRQKKDPLGNDVKVDKIIKDRSTYWVPKVQK